MKGTTLDLIREYGDKGWFTLEQAMEFLNRDRGNTTDMLRNCKARGSYNCSYDKRKYGTTFQYRITTGGKDHPVRVSIVREAISPMLKDLKTESKKNMATFNPKLIATIVARIEKTLDKLAEN